MPHKQSQAPQQKKCKRDVVAWARWNNHIAHTIFTVVIPHSRDQHHFCDLDELAVAEAFKKRCLSAKLIRSLGVGIQKTFNEKLRAGDLPMTQWLVSVFNANLHVIEREIAHLVIAINRGYLDMVKWLVGAFDYFDRETKSHVKKFCIEMCCNNNQLEMAKWLADKFEVERTDVRFNYNSSLRICCDKGNLEMAKWLVQRFGLNESDARSMQNHAMQYAIKNDHLEVVQWLVARFHLGKSDIVSKGNYNVLCETDVLKSNSALAWVVGNFGVTLLSERFDVSGAIITLV
jgi:hypothetical protein